MSNREAILDTALELFCARGYDAVGVQEIADRAGITKPTLYYYFGSKQGLLEAIVETNNDVLYEMLRKSVEQTGKDVAEKLYRIARAYFDFASAHPTFYRFLLSQFYSGRETDGYRAVYPVVTGYYKLLVQVFEDSAERLGNMNGRQEQFAVSFIGTLDSHIMMQDREQEKGNTLIITDAQTYEIVRQYLYGIFS